MLMCCYATTLHHKWLPVNMYVARNMRTFPILLFRLDLHSKKKCYSYGMEGRPTNIRIPKQLEAQLAELRIVFGKQQNVVNAALWLFSRASPEDQVKARRAVAAMEARDTRGETDEEAAERGRRDAQAAMAAGERAIAGRRSHKKSAG